MAETDVIPGARQEAVQPSLWDRLADDLPGVAAETEGLRAELERRLGSADTVDQLESGGTREIGRRTDLDDETRWLAERLAAVSLRRRRLEEGGIVVTTDVLREAVRRDIEMLFNVERLEADYLMTALEARNRKTTADLVQFPEVRRSVLNYGVPTFAGRTRAGDADIDDLAREIRDVLRTFEPRLQRDSVRVTIRSGDRSGLEVEIDAVLLLTPVPERLRLSTMIDLNSGQAATQLEDG